MLEYLSNYPCCQHATFLRAGLDFDVEEHVLQILLNRLGKVLSKVVATINFVRLDFGNWIKLPYCFEFKIGFLESRR